MKPLWKSDRQGIASLFCFTLLLLLIPLRWLGAVLISAIIHEMGHYWTVRILGGTVHSIKIGPTGAIMEASGLTQRSELISILAGPLAGLLPMLTIRLFPTIAICGFIQSAFNLLPFYPLDGGRGLRLIIHSFGGTDRCFRMVEFVFFVLLFLLCVYIYVHFRVSLFLFLLAFLFRKTPCKAQKNWI